MHENRTKYPTKKTQMYQQLQELPKKYKVLALVRMEKVRASQLLPLRKKLQGEVEIISVKDKIAKLALDKIESFRKFLFQFICILMCQTIPINCKNFSIFIFKNCFGISPSTKSAINKGATMLRGYNA